MTAARCTAGQIEGVLEDIEGKAMPKYSSEEACAGIVDKGVLLFFSHELHSTAMPPRALQS